MRSGTCTAQQTLTPEAASVLKHSLNLAARRGHSHVTPLHVASTLLSSKPTNTNNLTLLRHACLKSHPHPPHPLHSRALELCFNVALNRLPTSPPLLHSPSLSNALIAALKRAQAHQRRGSIDQQQHPQHQHQHPLLTIKVQLQHLIISILDDPSVSRVMREAGFSSTAVKNNIEDFSPHFLTPPPLFFSPPALSPVPPPQIPTDTTSFVFDVLLGRKGNRNNNNNNNVAIVGDSVGASEGVVFEVMRKVKMGEVPEEMKGAKFVEFQLGVSSNNNNNVLISELRRKVECCGNGGVVVYVGDLKWVVEGNNDNNNTEEVERLVGEVERFLVQKDSKVKVKIWVLAVASYQIYMRCQMRQPPLQTQWALQPVPVPSSGLALTLHASSVYDSRLSFFSRNPSQAMETKPFIAKEELTCCAECTSNFENEVQHLKSFQSKQVPSWLQQYNGNQSHSKDEFVELRRKWNRFCSSLHRDGSVQSLMGKRFSYSSSNPWWPKFHESNSISFTDHHQTPKSLQSSNLVPRFRRQQSCTTIEFDFGNATTKHDQDREPSLNSLKHMVGKEVKITLALGNPLFCDSSAESTDLETERNSRRGEILKLLRENVPWQSESIPCIAEAVVAAKNEKPIHWILIEGNDFVGKRKLALAIAESVFGSADFLFNLNAKSEDMEISRSEILERAMKSNRELVVLVEEVDMANSQFMKFLADGFESGKWGEVKEESIEKIIFILTKDDSSDKKKNRASSSSPPVIEMTLKIDSKEKITSDHKRKADWEFANKSKTQRINDTSDFENQNTRKDFSRQSSINTLDLNLKANEEEEEEEEEDKKLLDQISPISSDLTRETTIYDLITPNGFLGSIENRFIMNQKPTQNAEITEQLRWKIKGAYEESCKKGNWKWNWNWNWNWDSSFSVEDGVLDGILDGFGSFSNSLFEKWLKEIFQTGLESGRYGGKGEGGIEIRLCLDQKHILEKDGYMGSCLPKKIKLSSMD